MRAGRLRAVLFDAFGTLLDTRGLHVRATELILADLGLDHLDASEVHDRWDEELLALEKPENGPLPTWDVFKLSLKACLASYGVSVGSAELDRAIEVMEEVFRSGTKPFEDALELPAFCRELGLRTALVSNADARLLRHILSETGLDSLMDVIIISDEVGAAKPDERIFCLALEALGVRPHEALMVGDWRVDVIGARRAGLKSALVLRGREPTFLLDVAEGAVPDLIVEELRELKGPIASLALGEGGEC